MARQAKKAVRSARLSEEDDQKFLEIHDLYCEEYREKLASVGLDTGQDWTYAHTFTKMIRDCHDQLLSTKK